MCCRQAPVIEWFIYKVCMVFIGCYKGCCDSIQFNRLLWSVSPQILPPYGKMVFNWWSTSILRAIAVCSLCWKLWLDQGRNIWLFGLSFVWQGKDCIWRCGKPLRQIECTKLLIANWFRFRIKFVHIECVYHVEFISIRQEMLEILKVSKEIWFFVVCVTIVGRLSRIVEQRKFVFWSES